MARIVVVGLVVAVMAVAAAACGDGAPPGTTVTSTLAEGGLVQIVFERSGGVAGMIRTTTVATADLTPENAEEMHRLVTEAGFFDLPATISGDGRAADDFTYTITVVTRNGEHTVTTGDAAAPERLRPLLDWLNRMARTTN